MKIKTGQKIGRWTVISKAFGASKASWNCVCECGKSGRVFQCNLIRKHSTSCGCYNRERTSITHLKHGEKVGGIESKEMKIHQKMLTRCYNSKANNYERYGGRGIKVCDRWRKSLADFIKDMGRCPSPDHSIERMDNNGDYTPKNCKWATRIEQGNNRRNNVLMTFNGETLTEAQWARKIGINRTTISMRIKIGWTVERALTQPLRDSKK